MGQSASVALFAWLGGFEHELLLFASFWFAFGVIDEAGIDLLWLWLRVTGRIRTGQVVEPADAPLRGVLAVLVPAWQEAAVVGAMVAHALRVWPQKDLRLYVGCYINDAATLAALVSVAGDSRLRIVVHDRVGPTTKADCLNRLYAALCEDEARGGFRTRGVILHDAEDMVHPAGLVLLDRGLDSADFVQLPVRPEPQMASRWVAGHYCDEFAESHAKAMVVRDWLGVSLPAAGVGCAFSRTAIDLIASRRGSSEPFAAECLTEDYEMGLLVGEAGGRGRFLRVRDAQGNLVATREFFPAQLIAAVRQKTRWLHGIAFQGWERLGWSGSWPELWMRLRDRRGPLTAIVLTAGYALVLLALVLGIVAGIGLYHPPAIRAGDSPLYWLMLANLLAALWRIVARFAFTAREYGLLEGVLAVLRIPVGNVIAIMAARRALSAYLVSLRSGTVIWDHTVHVGLPKAALAT